MPDQPNLPSPERQSGRAIEPTPEVPRDSEPTPEIPKAAPELPSHPESLEISGKGKAPPPLPALPTVPTAPRDPVLAEIEEVLAENLQELYRDLPPDLKPSFKAKGEEIARAIREMIDSAKIRAGKILKFVRQWLRMIPGANRFFLEKEAAIKAQKIVTLAKERGGERSK
ncbi:hypothetical protein HYW17_06055 [Candidatus Uhrbacteria bacterium]|nr:hypothetical protein [Candidatus Uhrbacteria bacterium]